MFVVEEDLLKLIYECAPQSSRIWEKKNVCMMSYEMSLCMVCMSLLCTQVMLMGM